MSAFRVEGQALISNVIDDLQDRDVIGAELALRLAFVSVTNAHRRADSACRARAEEDLQRAAAVLKQRITKLAA